MKEVPSNLRFVLRETPIVVPCFAIVLYTRALLSKHRAAVLDAYDSFERLCPREALTFYRTETMAKRKPVTARTFTLLSTWLKPGAPRREYIGLDIGGGRTWDETSDTNFSVLGHEKDAPTYEFDQPSWIRMTLPLERMRNELNALEREAIRLFSSLPFVCGHAGPTLELSIYEREASQRFAWKTVMRYRGLDFCDPFADSEAIDSDGLRTVNWLTFIGDKIAAELGGAARISKRVAKQVEVLELPTGICLKAGPQAEFGDRHANERLANYESVFRACEPAINRMNERYSPMMLENDERENTTRLMRRLAYEEE